MSVTGLLRAALPFVLVLGAQCAAAAEHVVDHATMQRLAGLRQGDSIRLDAMPIGATSNASLRLQRVQIYAPDAHIWLMTKNGKQELPRSNRIFLRGYSDDGSARVAMVLEPNAAFVDANGEGPEGPFALVARADARGTQTFSAKPLDSTLPAPGAFEFTCGNEKMDMGLHGSVDLATRLRLATQSGTSAPGGATTAASFRFATIAIDSDSLFMSRLFSNNTTTATNWIASMFNTMNTMYETDLQVQLLIGTTILRTSAAGDPYVTLSSGAANGTDLNIFGSYWRLNEGSVPRSFAILLSGAIASSGGGCSAAGIAWLDEYCQKGFVSGTNTVGSYSVNKVCTNINVDPNGSFDARIVGHEIGHNFGAAHTHCTNITTGASSVATNTIDVCYNGEGGSGCYAGATSCPAGQTSGTIMSYCNISGCGTQNQLHFHATHISKVLLPDIAANTPSCLAVSDVIFADGFQ